MNPQLLQQFVAGARLVQNLTGEPITIAGGDYVCTASTMVTGEPEFVAGGVINKNTITVTILQADFPNAPTIDMVASFRGYAFRVLSYADAGISWQFELLQEQA